MQDRLWLMLSMTNIDIVRNIDNIQIVLLEHIYELCRVTLFEVDARVGVSLSEHGQSGQHVVKEQGLQNAHPQAESRIVPLMTDGRDLYMYHQLGGSMRKIWSTHLGVENFYGPIASGDLNGDGVKEIYCCDN